MHPFDIIVIALIGIFIAIGLKRGFIEEIFRLGAMLGGFIGAFLIYEKVYQYLTIIKLSSQGKTIIAFMLSYFIILFSLLIIGWTLKKIVHLTLLGWLDHALGGLIGLGKASVFIWIFILSVSCLPSSNIKTAVSSSQIYLLLNNLPLQISIPKTDKIKKTFKNIQKSKPIKKIIEAKDNLKKLKTVTDSFKTLSDSK